MNTTATPAPEPDDVDELHLTMGGTWTVHSTSDTVYRLDLDRRLLRREPGARSSRAPGDSTWVLLLEVRPFAIQADDTLAVDLTRLNVITVGRRHLYMLDPRPGTLLPYRWWLQRTVTRITRAPRAGKPEAD